MPRTIGLVDGTHINIQAPAEEEWAFVNLKNTHSVNVQVILRMTLYENKMKNFHINNTIHICYKCLQSISFHNKL